VEQQSTFRSEALRRYPNVATLLGDGPWAVLMNDGRLHIRLFRTQGEAVQFSAGAFRIVNLGPKVEPVKPRWWDRDDD